MPASIHSRFYSLLSAAFAVWLSALVVSSVELCEYHQCTPNCECGLPDPLACAVQYGNYGWKVPVDAPEAIHDHVRPESPIGDYEIKPVGMRGTGKRVTGTGRGIGKVLAIHDDVLVGQVYFEVHPDQLDNLSVELYGDVLLDDSDCGNTGILLGTSEISSDKDDPNANVFQRNTDAYGGSNTENAYGETLADLQRNPQDLFSYQVFQYPEYNMAFRNQFMECHPRSTNAIVAGVEFEISRPFDKSTEGVLWFPLWNPDRKAWKQEGILQYCIRIKVEKPQLLPQDASAKKPSKIPSFIDTKFQIEGNRKQYNFGHATQKDIVIYSNQPIESKSAHVMEHVDNVPTPPPVTQSTNKSGKHKLWLILLLGFIPIFFCWWAKRVMAITDGEDAKPNKECGYNEHDDSSEEVFSIPDDDSSIECKSMSDKDKDGSGLLPRPPPRRKPKTKKKTRGPARRRSSNGGGGGNTSSDDDWESTNNDSDFEKDIEDIVDEIFNDDIDDRDREESSEDCDSFVVEEEEKDLEDGQVYESSAWETVTETVTEDETEDLSYDNNEDESTSGWESFVDSDDVEELVRFNDHPESSPGSSGDEEYLEYNRDRRPTKQSPGSPTKQSPGNSSTSEEEWQEYSRSRPTKQSPGASSSSSEEEWQEYSRERRPAKAISPSSMDESIRSESESYGGYMSSVMTKYFHTPESQPGPVAAGPMEMLEDCASPDSDVPFLPTIL